MAYFWLHPIAPFRHLLRRRKIDPGSLQTRLTAGVVLTSLVGVGALSSWMGWRMQQIMLDSYRQGTALIADRLQEDVRYYSAMMPPQAALDRVIDHRATGDLAIWVETLEGDSRSDPSRNRLAQSDVLTMGSWQTSGVSEALMGMAIPPGTKIVAVQGWQLVVCASPLEVAGLPPATLYLADDITADYGGMQRLLHMLLLTSLVLIILLSAAFAFYIRRTLSSIRQLNRLASQVTVDTLDQPLNLEAAPTELQELVRTYNLMLARLSKAWGQQKRLVNDVSHELRTPLSLVQGYLESILRRGQNLTAAQREGLEIAAAEASRTTRLLSEILDLARLGNGQGVLNLEPADLGDIVREAVALATQGQPKFSPVPVKVVASAAVVALVDRQKLRTALVELLDNALRYGNPHRPVEISLMCQGQWATVQVQDYGAGIPTDCQGDIFDPFYRVDEARSRSSGGTGLGLTLVRSLVEAMGGHVTLQSQPNQGTCFTLHLPL
ncbi:HAMP domain-containing sensor histidine kinase [Leptolyngbya sp. CCNP1308]|uniref:sensor histidine kinase n=1 Tax=Leptolyngbya sp. CCNP1308 TaxID=3110255 RepID=UPI002B21BB58|nr:HAMP domain-containing sensor histidine kinase [Leptolyngbya sp. CCNP1308]MEA5450146.1 HAMP domain-containing sensor histidine kinase [Leptolyngbya sp. CCNP1308]